MVPVPEMHIELLEKEIAGLREDDLRYVKETFDRRGDNIRCGGKKLIERMVAQVKILRKLLDEPGKLSARNLAVTIAGLKYFERDTDGVHDDTEAGLVDDALVVQAAINELETAKVV